MKSSMHVKTSVIEGSIVCNGTAFFLIFSSDFQETTSNHEKDCKSAITNSKTWE